MKTNVFVLIFLIISLVFMGVIWVGRMGLYDEFRVNKYHDILNIALDTSRNLFTPMNKTNMTIENVNYDKELFCWVFTSSGHHHDRVPAVNKTWLPRCDYGIFFTNQAMNDSTVRHKPIWKDLPNVYLNSHNKTKIAWPYVYKNISSEYRWYYKGEDDGYLVAENLRSFLRNYNPDEPHYFGTWFKPYLEKGFNSGAGYVFSRKTLKLLVEALEKNPNFCPNADYEDLGMAICLNKLNITPEASVDSTGRHRFLPYSFHEVYTGFARDWYMHNQSKGFDGFSKELIQLHHNTPTEILLIDTMLYRVDVKDLNKDKSQ